MLVLQKLRELIWIVFKNLIYYAGHNNTKYYLVVSYLHGKPTNNRIRQKIQQNLMKCIKEQNRSGKSSLIETLQDQVNESFFAKMIKETTLHKHYGVNQKKDCQPHKFRIK